MNLFDIKKLMNGPASYDEPVDDFRIIQTWTEYNENSNLDYLCYELEKMNPETGQILHYYKAIKLARIIRLPASAKQSTSFMDRHTQILTSVYENNYNFITVVANIIKPVSLGLLFLYGVQGIAETIDEAKEITRLNYAGLIAMLQGTYKTLEMRHITDVEAEWLKEKLFQMDYLSVVRGIPKTNKAGEDAGNKGIGGNNLNPDSQSTMEEFIVGMVDTEYVIQVLSTPVHMDTLIGWQRQIQNQMTDWYGQLQGSKSVNFNLAIPMMYGANAATSTGSSRGYTDADTVSYSNGESFTATQGQSVGESLSQSLGQTVGHTAGESYSVNQGTTVGHTEGVSVSESYNQGFSQTLGISNGTGTSTNTGTSFNLSESQNVNQSAGASYNISNGLSQGMNTSFSQSASTGSSYNMSQSESSNMSHNVGTSENFSFSQNESVTQGNTSTITNGTTQSTGSSLSEGFANNTGTTVSHADTSSHSNSSTNTLGIGGSVGISAGASFIASANVNGSVNGSFSHSWGQADTVGVSDSFSETSGSSHTVSGSATSSSSLSESVSSSASTSSTQGYGSSQGYGFSEGYSVGSGQSISEAFGVNQSVGESQSIGNSVSQSNTYSQGVNTSTSEGYGLSQSLGNNFSSGTSTNSSVSESVGNTVSYGQSVGQTSSNSISQSITNGYGQSYSDSVSQSVTDSYSQNIGKSESVSNGQSYSVSNGNSKSLSTGTSQSTSMGTNASMGFSPSIGYSKSYQWMDQGVKDLLEVLEYSNNRLKNAINGSTGAFYTYMYIGCPTKESQAKANALIKSTWRNEMAKTQPLQVLDLTDADQQHLLYKFNSFSSDISKEDGRYKYTTVLLPEEYTAYTHPPRVSEGGIYTTVQDIPKFSTASMLPGDIYMGRILNPERFSMETGYRTPYDYRIDESQLMHGFFTGASRSGKTYAAMRFIAELSKIVRAKTGKRLRIVVLDPKQDWRTIARFVDSVRFNFYSMGNTNFRPICINPWKVPRGVSPQIWIDGLIEIYCRAYGLLERGKQMIAGVVYELYTEAGVFEAYNKTDWKETVPQMSSQVNFVKIYNRMVAKQNEFTGAGKAGSDTKDAYARLVERLSCFSREYSIERLLYGSSEGLGIDELIGDDEITVFESKGLEATFKNFIFGAITSGFYKYAIAHEGGFLAEDQYETVLVIEEANEVLIGNDTNSNAGGGASLPGQSEFEQMIDQSAGYGLFVIAITQKIADMPSSIVANAGLIFAGRTVREEDVSTIMRAIGREPRIDDRDLVKWFSQMPIGWVVAKTSRNFDYKVSEPFLCQVSPLNLKAPSNLELDIILAQKEANQILAAV